MYKDEYLELPLYFEDMEDDYYTTLYVYFKDKSVAAFEGVRHDPICYKGWWTIPFKMFGNPASANIKAEDVHYFVTFDPPKVTENVTLDECNCGHEGLDESWHIGDCQIKDR